MSRDQEPERLHWVALSLAAGIGPVRFQRLLQLCGSAEAAWNASELELAAAGLERRTIDSLRALRTKSTPDRIAQRLAQLGITPLTLADATYPRNLREIADPPPVLFVK